MTFYDVVVVRYSYPPGRAGTSSSSSSSSSSVHFRFQCVDVDVDDLMSCHG